MLLVIFGPPAVGKMTVGRAVCAASDFRLFHNHMTIEPLLETFGFGTPAFDTLNGEFRRRVLEEAARHGINLAFCVVWDLNSQGDLDGISKYIDIFDGDVAFVELRADLDTRLVRNGTESRLAEKKSKRDRDWSDANVREMEQHRMTSEAQTIATPILDAYPHQVIDNSNRSPESVAALIIGWLTWYRSIANRTLRAALEPVLCPVGFAKGQHGDKGEGTAGQLIFCSAFDEIVDNFPDLPQATVEHQSYGMGGCLDLMIEWDESGSLLSAQFEFIDLAETLRGQGHRDLADRVDDLIGGPVVEAASTLAKALGALFQSREAR